MRPYRAGALGALLSLVVALSATAQQNAPAVKVKEERAGMLKEATVMPEQATATALARVSGSTVKSAELEREDGKLVYSFDLVVAGKDGVEEVLVDAATGKVVSVEHEGPAAEAAEGARERSGLPVKEEHAGMLAQAKVTPEQALKAARARVPHSTVKSAGLEREEGQLVYSFDLAVPGREGVEEVWVDATTGKVLSVKHEDASREADEEDED